MANPYLYDHDRINIYLHDGNWMANFCGPNGEEVYRLFGTYCLPTPYTSQTNGEAVRREVESRNPGVEVVLI